MTARSNPADAQAEIPLAEVDVLDLRWFTDGPPHALFARMRAEDPVHRNPGPEGTIWSLTRHDDISAVSRDTATFSSHRGSIFLTKDDLMPLEIVQLLLLMKDPPEHTQYRLVLQKAFTPATVAKLEESVRDRVASLVDAAIERKDGDFVSDL